MSILNVDYRKLDNFNLSANRLITTYKNRAEGYDDISSRLAGTSSSDEVREARDCIRRKTISIREKAAKLEMFQDRTNEIVEQAKSADNYVCERIADGSVSPVRENEINLNVFYSGLVIKNKEQNFLKKLFENLSDNTAEMEKREVKTRIRDWYRSGGKSKTDIRITREITAKPSFKHNVKLFAEYKSDSKNSAEANRINKGDFGNVLGREIGVHIGTFVGKGTYCLAEIESEICVGTSATLGLSKVFSVVKTVGTTKTLGAFLVNGGYADTNREILFNYDNYLLRGDVLCPNPFKTDMTFKNDSYKNLGGLIKDAFLHKLSYNYVCHIATSNLKNGV